MLTRVVHADRKVHLPAGAQGGGRCCKQRRRAAHLVAVVLVLASGAACAHVEGARGGHNDSQYRPRCCTQPHRYAHVRPGQQGTQHHGASMRLRQAGVAGYRYRGRGGRDGALAPTLCRPRYPPHQNVNHAFGRARKTPAGTSAIHGRTHSVTWTEVGRTPARCVASIFQYIYIFIFARE